MVGFFRSLTRFFKSLFGLAQGKTERLTDKMVSASADTIRSQFRKTRDDWSHDYQEMRDAIAELIGIRDMKAQEMKKLSSESQEIQQKMAGAIELYKKNPDERYKQAYATLAEKCETNEARFQQLEKEIHSQEALTREYKKKLASLQSQIDSLNQEEAETVADIISSQKIRELNDRVAGLATDESSKSLEAIRQARKKANIVSNLSQELSQPQLTSLDQELKQAGQQTKYLAEFDAAVSLPIKPKKAEQIEPQ